MCAGPMFQLKCNQAKMKKEQTVGDKHKVNRPRNTQEHFSDSCMRRSILHILNYLEHFQLSVKSNLGLHWFCFTMLCDWSRKLAQSSQPIRRRTKTNRNLITRVFPRLRPVTCIYFEFSLVHCDIYLCSDLPL